MNSIGMKLQVERPAGGVQFADGFFQGIADRIADVLGCGDQLGGEGAPGDVSLAVRRAEAIEMPQTDALEFPAAFCLRGEAARLMSLGVTTDIDAETPRGCRR